MLLKRLKYLCAAAAFLVILCSFIGYHSDITVFQLQFFPAFIRFIAAPSLISVFILLIILTIVYGRVYCSFICPLGIYQDCISAVRKRFSKTQWKYVSSPNTLRYSIFIFLFSIFIFFSAILLSSADPYSIFSSFAAIIILPLKTAGNNMLSQILKTQNIYSVNMDTQYAVGIGAVILSFVCMGVITVTAFFTGRWWCNFICPVGTYLHMFSKSSIVRLHIAEKCISCRKCERTCPAHCINISEKTIDNSCCVRCFSCISTCPVHAISFTAGSLPSAEKDHRRKFIAGAAVLTISALFSPVKKLYTKFSTLFILPPGARNAQQFLSRCSGCHVCIAKCPTKVLKPKQIGGTFRPVLDYEHSFCEYECNVCSAVCPANALEKITLEQKKTIQIGAVDFKKTNCIVYINEKDCGACAEHCPTKAIKMVPYKKGLYIPETDVSLCVGCGACEFICPARPKAVTITPHTEHKIAKQPKKGDTHTIDIPDELPF